MKSILIMGTIIIKKTAKDWLVEFARNMYREGTPESIYLLSDVENKLIKNGLICVEEIEELEIMAM